MTRYLLAALAAFVLATAPDVASAADQPCMTICTHATDGDGAAPDALDSTITISAEVTVFDGCDVATPEVAAPDVCTVDKLPCDDGKTCTSDACTSSTCAEARRGRDDDNACTTDGSGRLRHLPYGGELRTADDGLSGESQFIMWVEQIGGGDVSNSSGACDDGNACGLVIAGLEPARTSIAES